MFPFWQIFLMLGCFVLGSVPVGPWLARRRGIDLAKQGSGNSGAANAIRVLGWRDGLAVLFLDVVKGALAVWIAPLALLPEFLMPLTRILFGTAAILGHNYSIFQRFKGGKGIATSFGVLLSLSPKVAILAGLLWIGLVGLTRISSIGSLGAAAAAPILLIVYGEPLTYVLFGFLAAGMAFHRHRGNIERLMQGTENQIDSSR